MSPKQNGLYLVGPRNLSRNSEEKKNPIASRFQRSVARLPFVFSKWQITGSRLSFGQPERVPHTLQGHSFGACHFLGQAYPTRAKQGTKRKPCRCNKHVDLYGAETSFEAKQVMMYTNPALPTTQACCCVAVVTFCHLAVCQRKTGVGCGTAAGILCSTFLPPPP